MHFSPTIIYKPINIIQTDPMVQWLRLPTANQEVLWSNIVHPISYLHTIYIADIMCIQYVELKFFPLLSVYS
jgi:hypothetical protein